MAKSQSLTNVTTPSSLAGSMSAMSVNDQYRGPQVRVANHWPCDQYLSFCLIPYLFYFLFKKGVYRLFLMHAPTRPTAQQESVSMATISNRPAAPVDHQPVTRGGVCPFTKGCFHLDVYGRVSACKAAV
jgi:hypothetical protein